MGDTQDSTEILLQKARERRLRKAESALLQREKTGAEKMLSTGVPSIASGIKSPTVARKTYTSSVVSGGVGRGVAGGVKGAKTTPKREIKAVPLDEIEDDFESLQEKMRGRFKQNTPDFKENLCSPNTPTFGSKRTFFDNPSSTKTPLSPSRQNIVLSPTKKFFPDIKSDVPAVPKRTTSRLGDLSKYSNTNKGSGTTTITSSPSEASQPAVEISPSPVKQMGSPLKRVDSTVRLGSPVKKHEPVKITASFRSRGARSPSRDNNPSSPKKTAPTSPGGELRTMPSIRLKPNSIVSRALAKLENKNLDDSKTTEESSVSEPVKTQQLANETVVGQVPVVELNTEAKPKASTPGKSNTTVDDSMFIRNNMDQIQNDLNAMRSDMIKEESDQEDSKNTEDSESFDGLCDEVMPEEPVYSLPIKKSRPQKNEEGEEEVKMETEDQLDDSLEDLCNDVMPSPTKSKEANKTEDSEWQDFSPDVGGHNTSLKRDADCLAESVFSSVESFISCDLTSSTSTEESKNERPKAQSPVQSQPVKKLRRSMSVSDLPKSPARFVRLDAMRCSSTSLQARNTTYRSGSGTVSVNSSYYGSGSGSVSGSREEVARKHKANTYKGPLEEGTLEARPPFEQVKVLEQGILVQKELEAQASQLVEHCQYGLEQVEAEKLLLVAGLKKELWKYHLAEVKADSHVFSTEGPPKGYLEIKNISLLLRQDYLVNQVVERKLNQAFFVAVKVSPYRLLTTNIATSECNIHGTHLSISDNIVIDNLPPDYKITLEVYCMSYNMMNNATPAKKKRIEASKSANTPKRLLQTALNKMGGQKSKADRPFTSSMESYSRGRNASGSTTPRGRGTRNTPTNSRSAAPTNKEQQGNKFLLAGTLNLSIKDAKKEQFRLRRAPFHSPFEGTINLSMTAKEAIASQPPSHKGFLTIFQDESGLGAWNRRWCSVQDNKIYYWLYPEDEVNQNKQPHGEIDLRNCKSETVSIASRLDCARPNTFVLVILQAAQPGDRTSIITESNGKTTQTKYLLSADSREERKQWMEVLNKCLQSVHSWNH